MSFFKKFNFIYKTTNLINGKIYVGQHCTDKLQDEYLGSGSILNNAIKKYGRENFKREILEFYYGDNRLDFNSLEKDWINKLDSINNGYNITINCGGGDNYYNHPNINEIKNKISVSVKNSERWTEEKRKINSERIKGDKNPMKLEINKDKFRGENNPMAKEEYRDKLKGANNPMAKEKNRIKQKENINKPEVIEKIRAGGVKGGKYFRTEETRRKLSIANTGHVCSQETKDKTSNTLKGRPNTWGSKIGKSLTGKPKSEDHRKKLSESRIKFYWVQLDKDTLKVINIFLGNSELKNKTGFDSVNIRDFDQIGFENRNPYGYKWKRFDKNEITKEEIYKIYG